MILHKLLKYEYLMTTCLQMAFVSDSHLPRGSPRALGVSGSTPERPGWKFKTGVASLGRPATTSTTITTTTTINNHHE